MFLYAYVHVANTNIYTPLQPVKQRYLHIEIQILASNSVHVSFFIQIRIFLPLLQENRSILSSFQHPWKLTSASYNSFND